MTLQEILGQELSKQELNDRVNQLENKLKRVTDYIAAVAYLESIEDSKHFDNLENGAHALDSEFGNIGFKQIIEDRKIILESK